VPALLYRSALGTRKTVVAGLLQATSLPFIVAATAIGRELDLVSAAEGAALVGAGLLSVLMFPIAGLSLLRDDADRRLAASKHDSRTPRDPAS
jgi:hypothetical protein